MVEYVLRGPRPWDVPERPGGPDPSGPASAAGLPPWLAERLYERRIVFLTGAVTAASASTAAATLLSLDLSTGGAGPAGFTEHPPGSGSDAPPAVHLHVAASDGDLEAVLTLIDAVDSMRAPVHAVATGEVGGAVVGIYAAARRRLAYPHARFRLAEPSLAGMAGTADDVASAAGRHLRALEDLVVRVAEATGQPRSRVEDDFSAGRVLGAAEAQEYGLVHEIHRRD
jgi:ATP-dependent Clp protease, protease subunit